MTEAADAYVESHKEYTSNGEGTTTILTVEQVVIPAAMPEDEPEETY
jgi:hypothetical protein